MGELCTIAFYHYHLLLVQTRNTSLVGPAYYVCGNHNFIVSDCLVIHSGGQLEMKQKLCPPKTPVGRNILALPCGIGLQSQGSTTAAWFFVSSRVNFVAPSMPLSLRQFRLCGILKKTRHSSSFSPSSSSSSTFLQHIIY